MALGWVDAISTEAREGPGSYSGPVAGIERIEPGGSFDTIAGPISNMLVPSALPDGGVGVPVQGRCGYGTRIPLLLAGPFVKKNYIDHTLTDQTSILRFIEDNWLGGERIQPGGSFDTIAGPISNMLIPAALPDGGAL